jgi:hypothetical protein
MIAAMQERAARAAGQHDVRTARTGMMLELPLTSREVNVRPL